MELRCQLIVRPGAIDESEIPVDVNYNPGGAWVVIRRTPNIERTVFCLDAEELSPRLGAYHIHALLGWNASTTAQLGACARECRQNERKANDAPRHSFAAVARRVTSKW